MTKTKNKTFKERVKETGGKVKAYGRKKCQQVKGSVEKYSSDIRAAYNAGYKHGWDDCGKIPDRLGTVTAAACGYGDGVKNRRKSDKYIKKYDRGATKSCAKTKK